VRNSFGMRAVAGRSVLGHAKHAETVSPLLIFMMIYALPYAGFGMQLDCPALHRFRHRTRVPACGGHGPLPGQWWHMISIA
jgi:hypothetical protein